MSLRDSFYMFATMLKTTAPTSYPASIATLFGEVVISLFVSFLPIVPYISNPRGDFDEDMRIFPHSIYLSAITPNFLSLRIWTSISIFMMLFPLVCFAICVRNHSMIVHLWWTVYPQLHLLLIPFVTVTFGFSICAFDSIGAFTGDMLALMIIVTILFPFYTLMTCALFFIETNSLINPNPIYAEWMYMVGFWYPLTSIATTLFSSISHHVADLLSVILLFLSAATQCIFVSYTFYKIPFLLDITNHIVMCKALLNACVNVLSIAVILSSVTIGPWIIVITPMLLISFFLISYVISWRRKKSKHQFLKQIDSSLGNYSVEVIRMTLSSTIRTENAFQWVIRESFSSGNIDVLSQRFLHACLQIYPSSQWLLSATVFMFALVWGFNSTTYRVLLNLISIDDLNPVASLMLFQCIYAYQQSSSDVSPMIIREIWKSRKMMAKYAEQHKVFWASAAKLDFDKFRESISGVCDCVRRLKNRLKFLKVTFPFCPVVHLELSLYYSDIRQNYVKSSEHFAQYEKLMEDKKEISNELYTKYINAFPITRTKANSDTKSEKNSNSKKLVFLSFHDKHEYASRCVIPPLKDSYFSLCQTYSLSHGQAKFMINFDRMRLTFFKIFFGLSCAAVIGLMIYNLWILNLWNNDRLVYQSIVGNINDTLAFRWYVSACHMDTLMLQNYQSNRYQLRLDEDTNQSFYAFLARHLSDIYDLMLDYKNIMDNMVTMDVEYALPTCYSLNCSFSYLFGSLHSIANYYIIGYRSTNPDYTEENLNTAANELLMVSDYIYQQLSAFRNKFVQEIRDSMITHGLVFIPLAVFLFSMSLLLFHWLARKLYQDLFLVISTVPSSVLKEVASTFDKITRFTGYNVAMPRSHLSLKITICLVISYALTLVFPGFLVARVHSLSPESVIVMPPATLLLDNSTQFMSFSIAYAEFSMDQQNNWTGKRDATEFGKGCVHSLTKYVCDDCNHVDPILGDQNILEIILAVFSVMLLVICMTYYVINQISIIHTFQTMQYFVKYIPERARNSNPVLNMLTKGKRISMKQIEDFRENATSFVFNDEKMGCILYFDSLGNFVTSQGNPSQFLPYVPSSITDIQQQLINNNCTSGAQIRAFFEEGRRGICNPKSVSLRPYSEITLAFSHKGSVLLVVNNSRHYILNQQIRNMQKIHYNSAPKSESFKNMCIIIFEVKGSNSRNAIKSIAPNDFDLRDTRHRRLVFVKLVSDFKSDVDSIVDFIMNAGGNLTNGRCACAYGSGYIFGKNASYQIIRNRVYGETYEKARLMLRQVSNRQAIIPKSFIDQMENPPNFSELEFHSPRESFPVVIIDCL